MRIPHKPTEPMKPEAEACDPSQLNASIELSDLPKSSPEIPLSVAIFLDSSSGTTADNNVAFQPFDIVPSDEVNTTSFSHFDEYFRQFVGTLPGKFIRFLLIVGYNQKV